jgi:hypothetical protein
MMYVVRSLCRSMRTTKLPCLWLNATRLRKLMLDESILICRHSTRSPFTTQLTNRPIRKDGCPKKVKLTITQSPNISTAELALLSRFYLYGISGPEGSGSVADQAREHRGGGPLNLYGPGPTRHDATPLMAIKLSMNGGTGRLPSVLNSFSSLKDMVLAVTTLAGSAAKKLILGAQTLRIRQHESTCASISTDG